MMTKQIKTKSTQSDQKTEKIQTSATGHCWDGGETRILLTTFWEQGPRETYVILVAFK